MKPIAMTNIKLAKNKVQNAFGYTVKYDMMNNPRPQSGTTRLSLMLMTMPMAKIDANSMETVSRTRVRVPLDLLFRSEVRSIASTYAAPNQTKDAPAAWPVISPNTVTIINNVATLTPVLISV